MHGEEVTVGAADALCTAGMKSPAPGDHSSPAVRVLHVNAGNLYGGVETLLVTLASARHLCAGMEPHFAVCYEGRLSRELTAAGVPVHMLGRVRISQPWTVWRARRLFRRLLLSEHFDLVVCHMSWSLSVFGPTARRMRQRVAVWNHGFQTRYTWLDRVARRAMPDIMISNSRFTAGKLGERFPAVPQQVIYCPVEPPSSASPETWRSELRDKLGVKDGQVVILQVSRMEAWKGHGLLLESLARLKDLDQWVCWIVGGAQKADEESYLEQLRAKSKLLGLEGRVRFLGQRSDVPKLMAAADIFCQPNLEPEPFGIVFIEALWAGRPVVTTALGGALEIVVDSCGCLTKPGDSGDLALGLRRLIDSRELRNQLGRGGAVRAKQLCDPASQLHKLEALTRAGRSA